MLVVFPGNKLVSTDSVAPILLELKKKYNIRSDLITFDKKTYNGILENVVLRDVIDYVGGVTYVNKRNLFSLLKLLRYYIVGFFGTKYIHFGLLNNGPLSILWRVHSNKVYYTQSDSYGHNHKYYREKLTGKASTSTEKLLGCNIIAFNNLMPELKTCNKHTKVFLFGESRTRKEWLRFTKSKSDDYFRKYHPRLKLENKFIVFILGPVCSEVIWLKEKDSYEKMFYKTIEILREYFPLIKVLIKPHVTTELTVVNSQIEKDSQFEITYLHPSVLAQYASCFICNLYSTTLADAYSIGARTIEYTDYNEQLLVETDGKSVSNQYVDYFVNNDELLLIQSLRNVLYNPDNKRAKTYSNINDDSGLLIDLATKPGSNCHY